jgi:hypothetical protein
MMLAPSSAAAGTAPIHASQRRYVRRTKPIRNREWTQQKAGHKGRLFKLRSEARY